ncbi:MAG: hypothetical protein U0871_10910 [Gemmataceae bacterium]
MRLSAALWSQVVAASKAGGGAEYDATVSQLSRREAAAFAGAVRRGLDALVVRRAARPEYDPAQFFDRGRPAVHALAPADADRVERLLGLLTAGGGVSLSKTLPEYD